MTTWIDTHADDDAHLRVTLLEWRVTTPAKYWAAFDASITTGGTYAPAATWTGKAFAWNGGRLEFADATATVLAIVLANRAVGTEVKIWEAWINPTASTLVSSQEVARFHGRVNTWISKADRLTMELTQLTPFTAIPIPRRPYTTACSLPFKGTACAYAGGDASCLRTLTDCISKSNSANFGGFPRIDPR